MKSPSTKLIGITTVRFPNRQFCCSQPTFSSQVSFCFYSEWPVSLYDFNSTSFLSIRSGILHCWASHLGVSKPGESRAGHKFSSDCIRLIFSHCSLQSCSLDGWGRWWGQDQQNERKGNADRALHATLSSELS